MKMTVTIALPVAAAAALLAMGCGDASQNINVGPSGGIRGNGKVVEETRAVHGISRVDHQGVGKLYIQQGNEESLLVRAEENLVGHLLTDVASGELEIWKDALFLTNTRPIEYHLTVVDLDRVELSGSGRVQGTDLHTGPLELRLSGFGDIHLTGLAAPSVDVANAGVGDVVLSGSAQEQTIELETLGDYDGSDLTSASAEVLVGGGGSATVRVRDHLKATIRGAGNVYYYGSPSVDSSIQGSGRVERLGD